MEIEIIHPSDEEITIAYEEQLKKSLVPIRELGFYAAIYYQDIQHLEGKILTIIDASISDTQQRKAVKDLIRRSFWFDWAEHLEGKCENSLQNGMPEIKE